MSLPGDVQRILTFDELPASVREIRHSSDPLQLGILMQHQRDWIADTADLKLCEKGRRTGVTWAEAHDDTITAASSRAAGGNNVYYIGDTKEKGLEFIGYCAHFARIMASAMADTYEGIEVILFEDQKEDGSTRQITSYRIRFASGFQITALSSRPANIRGLQGIVVIDEAAFHPDVDGVITAANALIIWGGKIRIISTHNGWQNPFNQLIQDTKRGDFDFSLHRYTFDDAVANGLYERVCFIKGEAPSDDNKAVWYNKVRRTYGNRITQMKEELDAIPQQGSGMAINSLLAESRSNPDHKVIRWSKPSEYVLVPPAQRERDAENWIADNLTPLIKTLPNTQFYLGEDYARHRNFSVFALLFVDDDMTRKIPITIELHNIPTRQQEQILWHLLDSINFACGAMDATGSGETLAEYTADKYGHQRIHQIKLNNSWYSQNMGIFENAFTEDTIEIPRDRNIIGDITSLRRIDGITKPGRLEITDTEDASMLRHCDAGIAYALGYFATLQDPPTEIGLAVEDNISRERDYTVESAVNIYRGY